MEINALRKVDGEIVDYTVKPVSLVASQQLRDHVFVALRTALEPLIDRLFDPDPEPAVLPPGLRLSFNVATTVEQLHRFPAALSIGVLQLQAGADPDHVAVTLHSLGQG
ncbi:hypothetical protein [Synechococcus sp. CS-1328]|uniref:hypothetical protein n=1 Tax=Synechococcus sp. CS-1328 TaxID=2847976 RepID=UPI00223B5A29|nr:hypothetical protein [Synechococcus sp. CS-1328]MCT0224826.1 hypothetical protein [Synechococcus sp. CS-1328]